MFYYEVLPLKKTGSENRTFTYELDLKVPLGTIVKVPLKNKMLRGIVMKTIRKPKYKTRTIDKILTEEPVLDENQLKLAHKISDYYYCNLGETINAFLPFELGKKRREIGESIERKNKPEKSLQLTVDQQKIFNSIKAATNKSTHLIHGVTGSGKTEIYLQLVEEALNSNRGSIILVPEISLTPQTLTRFESRFPERVAVWHSQLKETEKFKNWNDLRKGNKMIVLGARSTIFMPIKNLQYIIIDEEHESSYKQDQNPKYDTIKVARWLAEISSAKVVLGSATPKIESFQRSQNKKYNYYSLNNRIVQNFMPPVSVVDMRDEFRKGNKSIFSDDLTKSIWETLAEKKQILLFINRRGASTFIVCRDCGYVEKCPNCEIPLVYHPNEGNQLICHHCNYLKNTPSVCPKCKSYAIKYFGIGTQRVELELKKIFPKAKIMRMDRDTTKKRGAHDEIFTAFSKNECDILIGTQIIAKGWDLPDVNLVGVIAADTTLNIPDYQNAEKTFGLLTQVAGRTGRSYHPGKVVIQTYNPDNYALKYAKNHDYLGFYQEEIESRRKYVYPPFSTFIKLTYRAKNEEKAEEKTHLLFESLKLKLLDENIELLGPSTSFIYKKNGFYHWQIIIKIKNNINDHKIIEINNKLKKIIPTEWAVDVEPGNLL